jgi:hypothetical protein
LKQKSNCDQFAQHKLAWGWGYFSLPWVTCFLPILDKYKNTQQMAVSRDNRITVVEINEIELNFDHFQVF